MSSVPTAHFSPSRPWAGWVTFVGMVLGAGGLTFLAIRTGGYVDGWPTYILLGGLGGGLLGRLLGRL